ncbi:proline--tRNA ligase, partial [Candidatus Bathyarchaeota archaeon]|nr:proline--tRNA ligase [Candidatus Bathyarchaeota archaeon]
YTPGWKFHEWELKGIPIRIEIGPRDLKQNQITLARRDTYQKTNAKIEDTVQATKSLLDEIQENLYVTAKERLIEKITKVDDYEAFKDTLKTKGGFLKAAWCGKSSCEEKIKAETGATIRLKPFIKELSTDKCILCNEESEEIVYFARSY